MIPVRISEKRSKSYNHLFYLHHLFCVRLRSIVTPIINLSNPSLIKTAGTHLNICTHMNAFLNISLMYLTFRLVNVVYRKMVCRIFYTFNISIKFSFVSKAGVPSKPGIPKLLEGSKNSIQWEKADDNGSRLMYYILEIRYVCLQKSFVNYKDLSSWL